MSKRIILLTIAVVFGYMSCGYAAKPSYITTEPDLSADTSGISPERLAEEKELQEMYPGYRGVDADYVHGGKEALERWQDRKFGLRIHWGYYSMFGGPAGWSVTCRPTEWGYKSHWPERTKESKIWASFYSTLYQYFNPILFDAEEWMDIIERGGMKYFTFTTKHHAGLYSSLAKWHQYRLPG